MAYSNSAGMTPVPFVAGGTISANRVVELDSSGNVTAANAIADEAIGVALTAAASGDQVQVQIGGIAKITASAAVSIGDAVMVTASGSGKVSTSSGATALDVGIALEAAAADGDVIAVLLRPALRSAANT